MITNIPSAKDPQDAAGTFEFRLSSQFAIIPVFFLSIAGYFIWGLLTQRPWHLHTAGGWFGTGLICGGVLLCLVLVPFTARRIIRYRVHIDDKKMVINNQDGVFEIPLSSVDRITYETLGQPRVPLIYRGLAAEMSKRFYVHWGDQRTELHPELWDSRKRTKIANVLVKIIPRSKQPDVVKYLEETGIAALFPKRKR